MKQKGLIISIILVIVAALAGFFGGIYYQKSQTASRFAMYGGGQGGGFARRFGANGQNGGAVVGSIVSMDNNSVTVQLPDGSSKIIILSSGTSINKQATGTKDDLKTGEKIAAFGTVNSDGSVTAQTIQLNPIKRMRPSGAPAQGQ